MQTKYEESMKYYEKSDKNYYITLEEFNDMLAKGRFLATSDFGGLTYGFSRDEYEKSIEEGKLCVVVCDMMMAFCLEALGLNPFFILGMIRNLDQHLNRIKFLCENSKKLRTLVGERYNTMIPSALQENDSQSKLVMSKVDQLKYYSCEQDKTLLKATHKSNIVTDSDNSTTLNKEESFQSDNYRYDGSESSEQERTSIMKNPRDIHSSSSLQKADSTGTANHSFSVIPNVNSTTLEIDNFLDSQFRSINFQIHNQYDCELIKGSSSAFINFPSKDNSCLFEEKYGNTSKTVIVDDRTTRNDIIKEMNLKIESSKRNAQDIEETDEEEDNSSDDVVLPEEIFFEYKDMITTKATYKASTSIPGGVTGLFPSQILDSRGFETFGEQKWVWTSLCEDENISHNKEEFVQDSIDSQLVLIKKAATDFISKQITQSRNSYLELVERGFYKDIIYLDDIDVAKVQLKKLLSKVYNDKNAWKPKYVLKRNELYETMISQRKRMLMDILNKSESTHIFKKK